MPERHTHLVVAPERDDRIVRELESDDRIEVTVASLDDAPDGVEPACLVLATDRPELARALLETVGGRYPGVPAVVASTDGGERLATVALRGGAADYVSLSKGDDLPSRVLAAIDASTPGDEEIGSGTETGPQSDDQYVELLANRLPDEAFVIDEDGYYLEAKVRPNAEDLYKLPAEDLVGHHIDDAFPSDVAADLLSCIDRTLETGEEQSIEYEARTTCGTRLFEGRVVPTERRIGGRRAVVWLARDITKRAEREASLRRRRDQLETLNRINAVVRRVIRTLVEVPTRTDIEREVCEQLVDSDLYCGSWIGELTATDDVVYRVGAGEADAYLDRVQSIDVDFERPVARASRTSEIQITNRMLDSLPMPDDLREAARKHDIRSAIAVPITHDQTVYGVLVVLASRSDAFGDRERSAFSLLGETIGFTINAVKNRRLLFADSVVELELRVDGADSLSFVLTDRYDCRCTLEWAGTTACGDTYQYVTIDGICGETVLEEVSAHDSIEECRLIHDGDDRCTAEVRLRNSGVRTLTNHGATILDVTVENGVGTATIEVPRDANVRELVDAFKTVYENAELVARREVDRPVHTADERRERIVDKLTKRQLTALRLAYYGGYFDWPRGSTGEEIAEAMDVSPPTMHQHLRKAQRTLLSEFFEDGGGTTE